jgi:hypothetical protein
MRGNFRSRAQHLGPRDAPHEYVKEIIILPNFGPADAVLANNIKSVA